MGVSDPQPLAGPCAHTAALRIGDRILGHRIAGPSERGHETVPFALLLRAHPSISADRLMVASAAPGKGHNIRQIAQIATGGGPRIYAVDRADLRHAADGL